MPLCPALPCRLPALHHCACPAPRPLPWQPLGNLSLSNAGLHWLTVEQVLADYAELVQAVRQVSSLQRITLCVAAWTVGGSRSWRLHSPPHSRRTHPPTELWRAAHGGHRVLRRILRRELGSLPAPALPQGVPRLAGLQRGRQVSDASGAVPAHKIRIIRGAPCVRVCVCASAMVSERWCT